MYQEKKEWKSFYTLLLDCETASHYKLIFQKPNELTKIM